MRKGAGYPARGTRTRSARPIAVEMCLEGVPLPAIRDVLGHTNLSVTDA